MAKILIVDDEPVLRESLEIGLQSRGFTTISASNGSEALTMALRQDPDLILLDVMMPDMDGMTVCKRLKALLGNFVPIILVTALGETEDKIKGTEHGADDYVTKPFKLEELLARITAMLRIKSQQDRLRETARTDYLTGVFNRRYLQSRLRQECAKAKRSGSPLSCLMLDLDGFKGLNDKHGHQFGDKVIKTAVDLVRGFVGPMDLFARYGGDEFVILFPSMTVSECRGLAEKIRQKFAGEQLNVGNEKFNVTLSIGVCGFPSTNLSEMEDLIQAMDEVLFASKKRGRNSVTVFEEN